MTIQLTMEDVLKLVEFKYVDGKWKVRRVNGNVDYVCGDVRGIEGNVNKVNGTVYRVNGDVGDVIGNVDNVKGNVEYVTGAVETAGRCVSPGQIGCEGEQDDPWRVAQSNTNMNRQELQERIINKMIDGKDTKTAWPFLYTQMEKVCDQFSDEQLLEQFKEYCPELLEE